MPPVSPRRVRRLGCLPVLLADVNIWQLPAHPCTVKDAALTLFVRRLVFRGCAADGTCADLCRVFVSRCQGTAQPLAGFSMTTPQVRNKHIQSLDCFSTGCFLGRYRGRAVSRYRICNYL